MFRLLGIIPYYLSTHIIFSYYLAPLYLKNKYIDANKETRFANPTRRHIIKGSK